MSLYSEIIKSASQDPDARAEFKAIVRELLIEYGLLIPKGTGDHDNTGTADNCTEDQ